MSTRTARHVSWLLERVSDRALGLRDRLVSDLSFQRAASRIPFVRSVARAQARDVFDLCAGFVYSQVLFACVELGLLQRLRRAPATVAELAAAYGLSDEATGRLIAAAVSLKLLSYRSRGRVGLGMRGAAIAANPGLEQMIAHHAMFYRDIADPVAFLRGTAPATELSRYWGYARADAKALNCSDVQAYSELMSASQTLVADSVLDAYPMSAHGTMLDVAGGDGTFISKAAARHSHLRFQHFDLPAVSQCAARRFAAWGLAERVQLNAGSFFEDELPKGADLVTLIRILHDHDDASVEKILSRIRRAIVPGGVLLVAEPMSGTRGAQAMGDAYFGFYLMAMGRGRPRRRDELEGFLRASGFTDVRERATSVPLQSRILTAQA